MNEEPLDGHYYKRQIKGLILILKSPDTDSMIATSYIIEKLEMILDGGIGFHAAVKEVLELYEERGMFKDE